MAISTPSESPAVVVREVDLTGRVPNVTTSTGATVGNFRWGPVNQRVLVPNEASLVNTFSQPGDDNAIDFLSAAYFTKYSSNLYIVRGNNGGINAHSATTKLTGDSAVVENLQDWEQNVEGAVGSTLLTGSFIAKYPGVLGNSLSVSICPPDDSAGSNFFESWSYKDNFDGEPGTSSYAASLNATKDEIHIAVIDRTGNISGTPGAVLETFPYVSVAKGAVTEDGSPNYISDVLNNNSNFLWNGYFGDDSAISGFHWGKTPSVDSALDYAEGTGVWTNANSTINLGGGVNSSTLTNGQILSAFDLFEDVDTVQVDMLIAPQRTTDSDAVVVTNDLVSIANSRKDCVVVASPPRNAVIGTIQPVTDIVAFANACTNSSYLILDNNYLKIYDKYNDKFRYIPAASSTAGLMAATDLVAAPWFSPAGSRRGNYLGITDIAFNPSQKTQRDSLYKAGVNPIANIPGIGVVLYGDKTKLGRPSAFDRINVRRLFLAIERAIAIAGKNVMFEFNDAFTRAEFVNIVEPFLREIKGRRGITDFYVQCDESNNTPEVVDRNEFIASIYIKPARSINYVTLNFVATRTGANFEEIVGRV